MDPEVAVLVRQSVGALLDGAPTADELYAGGWDDVVGAGWAPAWCILFDEVGRRGAACTLIDAVVAHRAGTDPATTRVAYAADGAADVALVLGGWSDGPPATVLWVAADGAARSMTSSPPLAVRRAVLGIDPELGVVEVSAGAGETSTPLDDGGTLTGVARTAIATVMLGACRAMLGMAVEHVAARRQFGRAIGEFQAVRHHLADVHVAVDAAQAAVDEAWATGDPAEAELAKVLAGDAAATTTRWVLQVMGAIGFTWEHALHRYTRRVLMLDAILGSSRELRVELGRRLRRLGEAPRVGRL